MKKVAVMLLIACCVAVAQANVLTNPDFEDGPTGQMDQPIPGWSTWGNSGWHHDDAGRTIDTLAVKLWWSDAGYWQDIEVEEGHSYTFSAWMQWSAADALGVDKKGVLKVEWFNTLAAAPGDLIATIVFGEITSADPVDTWIEYSQSFVAPAGAVVGRIVLAMETGPGTDDGGSINYDDASIYEFYGQAYAPDPADGATVDLSLDDLSWSNRPSGTPGDTVTFDVYFEDEGIIVDPNLYDPNFTGPAIATGITAKTINLTAESITLADEHTYSWRVDSHDPNTSGSAVNTQGLVWLFQVSDTAPTVDADVDTVSNIQYTWVDEADADNDANTVTLTLSGAYTDDGKSPITEAYFEAGAHEQAGGTIVTIGTQTWTPGAGTHTAGTVTAPVTITNAVEGQAASGLYRFWLNVTDGAGNSANETTRIVYMTCLEAAQNDPDDPMYQDWVTGDIDGDCNTDLVDFSILASYWVECMTPKAGCTP